jgi:cytidylate kinase
MPVIAVDGPAASGKGTIARRLAAHFGFPWLDTGLLYRAVGMRVPDSDPEKAAKIAQEFDAGWLADENLRSGEAGVLASKVSAIPAVRDALLAFQKRFADQKPGHRNRDLSESRGEAFRHGGRRSARASPP